jgi:hypothetical protein
MRRLPRGRGVAAALWAGVLVFSLVPRAWAQIPRDGNEANGASSADSARVLDLTIVAGGEDAEPLVGTIQELVGRLGLGVVPHVVAFPEPPPTSSRTERLDVWIDLASRYEAAVIVRSARPPIRRTIARDASPAIVREEIGEAVRSAVEAQLAPEEPTRASPTPVEPPTPSAPAVVVVENPPPLAVPAHALALDVTVLAGGGPISSQSGLAPRVGGGVIVRSRHGLRPSLAVEAEYVAPFHPELSGVVLHTTIVSLRAVPAIEVLRASWIAVDLGAEAGIDVVSVDPTSPSVQTESVPTHVDPMVGALATAYVGLTPGVVFTLVAGAEMDLRPATYFVGPEPGASTLEPWRFRPVVLAGFTFTTAGSPLFAARAP